jgi:hypothetical protein
MDIRRPDWAGRRDGKCQRYTFPWHISVTCSLTTDLVEFRMVVFRPFKGEVIVARIAEQSPEGINRL